MEGRLRQRFQDRLQGIELVASGGGCFEVDIDGERIYSKLETGSFPEEAAIEAVVAERLG